MDPRYTGTKLSFLLGAITVLAVLTKDDKREIDQSSVSPIETTEADFVIDFRSTRSLSKRIYIQP